MLENNRSSVKTNSESRGWIMLVCLFIIFLIYVLKQVNLVKNNFFNLSYFLKANFFQQRTDFFLLICDRNLVLGLCSTRMSVVRLLLCKRTQIMQQEEN